MKPASDAGADRKAAYILMKLLARPTPQVAAEIISNLVRAKGSFIVIPF
ncbi:hypothetical protein [Aureimonas glaciei]|uniref:Uncharacterized protein n=1 Tax=Aureimonas glaciei TaxID=1776957 RepID=A0A916YGN1_9HYPH|nr:hypothetical protein [Aureimonas glaciei]GGD44194.1 hypothetical protein GCM10011335_53460 [Aureimonas glaciei]